MLIFGNGAGFDLDFFEDLIVNSTGVKWSSDTIEELSENSPPSSSVASGAASLRGLLPVVSNSMPLSFMQGMKVAW